MGTATSHTLKNYKLAVFLILRDWWCLGWLSGTNECLFLVRSGWKSVSSFSWRTKTFLRDSSEWACLRLDRNRVELTAFWRPVLLSTVWEEPLLSLPDEWYSCAVKTQAEGKLSDEFKTAPILSGWWLSPSFCWWGINSFCSLWSWKDWFFERSWFSLILWDC